MHKLLVTLAVLLLTRLLNAQAPETFTPLTLEGIPVPGSHSDPFTVTAVDNASLTIGTFEKFELAIKLPTTEFNKIEKFLDSNPSNDAGSINPYDPDQIRIEADFDGDPGGSHRRYGFYYKHFGQKADLSGWDYVTGSHISNRNNFRIRFAPEHTGITYVVRIRVYINNVQVTKAGVPFEYYGEFTSTASPRTGFLSMGKNKHFVQQQASTVAPPDQLKSFFAIGQDIAGAPANFYGGYDVIQPSGYNTYRSYISNLDLNNGNFIRHRMDPHDFDVEWEELGVYGSNRPNRLKSNLPEGFIGQKHAWEFDQTLMLCEERDIYMLLVLELDIAYGNGNFWGITPIYTWVGNPYATLLGSTDNDVIEFFNTSAAKEKFKKKLFYLMARYGYSKAIGAWNLMNETSNVGLLPNPDPVNSPWVDLYKTNPVFQAAVGDWCHEMAAYLKSFETQTCYDKEALNNVYPVHLVTNGYGIPPMEAEHTFLSCNMDLAVANDYTGMDPNTNTFHRMTYSGHPGVHNKPFMFGEIGDIPGADAAGDISFHCAVWATSFQDNLGNGTYWWDWTQVNGINHRQNFNALANFMNTIDFQAEDFHPYSEVFLWETNQWAWIYSKGAKMNYMTNQENNASKAYGWFQSNDYWWPYHDYPLLYSSIPPPPNNADYVRAYSDLNDWHKLWIDPGGPTAPHLTAGIPHTLDGSTHPENIPISHPFYNDHALYVKHLKPGQWYNLEIYDPYTGNLMPAYSQALVADASVDAKIAFKIDLAGTYDPATIGYLPDYAFNALEVQITASNGGILCTGNSTTLSVPFWTGASYQWNLNGSPILGANNNTLVVNATTTGVFDYTVTVINASGTIGQMGPYAVSVNTLSIASSNGAAFCTDGTTVLSVLNPAVGATYQWQYNGVDINGATGSTYEVTNENPPYNASGNYTVSYSNSVTGCVIASNVLTLTVNETPSVNINPNPFVSCAPMQLVATSNLPIDSFIWSNGSTNSSTNASLGINTVTVTTVDGCAATANFVVTKADAPCNAFTTLSGAPITISTFNNNVNLLNNTTAFNIAVNTDIIFEGPGVFTIKGPEFIMGENVSIYLVNGAVVNVNGAWMHTCCGLWGGFYVGKGCELNIISDPVSTANPNGTNNYSIIEDAGAAVTLYEGGGKITTENVVFNRNKNGILFGIMGPLGDPGVYGSSIKSTIFTSRALPSNLTQWLGKFTGANFTAFKNTLDNYTGGFAAQSTGSIPPVPTKDGARPETGISIELDNSDGHFYTIGDVNPTKTNIFDNMDYGIKIEAASVKIINNKFQYMSWNDPTFSKNQGIGIKAVDYNGGYHFLQIGNAAKANTTNFRNVFLDCYKHVHVDGYLTLIFNGNGHPSTAAKVNNSITPTTVVGNLDAVNVYGLHVSFDNYTYDLSRINDMNHVIAANYFRNNITNVYLTLNEEYDNCGLDFFGNNLLNNFSTTKFNNYGLVMESSLGGTGASFVFSANNCVNSKYNAMRFVNVDNNLIIEDNAQISVSADASLTNERSALYLDKCDGAFIINNSNITTALTSTTFIPGNTSFVPHTGAKGIIGIDITNCLDLFNQCNSVQKVDVGMYYNGNCQNTTPLSNVSFANNTIDLCNYGLWLDNKAVVAEQGTPGSGTSGGVQSGNLWGRLHPSNIKIAQTHCTNITNAINFPLNVDPAVHAGTLQTMPTVNTADATSTAYSTSGGSLKNAYITGPTCYELTGKSPGIVVEELEANTDEVEEIIVDGNTIKLYPNPNNGEFTLELLQAQEGQFIICDVNGRIVYQSKLSAENRIQQVNLAGISNGIYYCTVKTKTMNKALKLVIGN